LRGEEIPLEARILCLAQTVEVFEAAHGVDVAFRVAVTRSGQWFDPMLVDALAALRNRRFWDALAEPDLSAVSPPDHVLLADERRLDHIAEAFSDVVDAKSPWTHRHSERVRAVATGIAARLGFDPRVLRDLSHASMLHDIGKLAISNRILDKPGPLTDDEYAKVKRHPVVTEQILQRVPGFSDIASLASAHHERLDGRGYPRGLTAAELTMPMRVLAVADMYEALTEDRPYRAAWTSERALEIMRSDVPERLDRNAFAALKTLLEDSGKQTEVAVLPASASGSADA
jgi:HD-GYP domain-containing protein (c-di-GMP phosphodiesterase class II)